MPWCLGKTQLRVSEALPKGWPKTTYYTITSITPSKSFNVFFFFSIAVIDVVTLWVVFSVHGWWFQIIFTLGAIPHSLSRHWNLPQDIGTFFRDPQYGDALLISFPYHSHTSRDSYGSGMGVVWEWGSHLLGGPWNFPWRYQVENTPTSWFKPWPFYPLVGGHDSPLEGSRELTIPKRARSQNCQVQITHPVLTCISFFLFLCFFLGNSSNLYATMHFQ